MAGKAQIVDQLVAGGATRTQAAAAVDAVLDAITASLAAGERVTLTGFGTFEPTERSARTARNPRTGSSVEVAATTVARFRPGTALRAAVASGSARGPAEPALVARAVKGGATLDLPDALDAPSGKGQGKKRDDPEGGKHGSAATGEAPAGAASVVTRSAGKAGKGRTKAPAASGKDAASRSAASTKPTKDDKARAKTKTKAKGKAKVKGKDPKGASASKSGKKRAKK